MADAVGAAARWRSAVIGRPVNHSLSPVLHRAAYRGLGLEDWTYGTMPVEPSQLEGILTEVSSPAEREAVWAGLSVTMPHKRALLPMLDVVDPLAAVVGVVNTVVAQRSGTGPALLAGVNTDVAGIVGALRETAVPPARPGQAPPSGRSAVVLGSGATACSALAALSELGVTDLTVAARRHAGPGRAATAAHRMGLEIATLTWRPGQASSDTAVAESLVRSDLVISTLPARAADTLAGPLATALEHSGGPAPGAVMLDVVYAPWPTPLASAWSGAGGATAPGWLMLLHQAVPQVTLMTGRTPPTAPMRRALHEALAAR